VSERREVYERTWKLYERIMACLGGALLSAIMCVCLGPLRSLLPEDQSLWVLVPIAVVGTLGFIVSVILAIVFTIPWVKAHRQLDKM